MKNVRIKWEELLSIVQANRLKHAANLEISWKGWREAVLAQVKVLEDVTTSLGCTKQESIDAIKAELKKFDRPPQSHLADYDRLIKMIELTDETHIELSTTEFDQYVLDEWSWKQDFVLSNSKYGATA